jgi:fibronectin-binding autotransporter adhesin
MKTHIAKLSAVLALLAFASAAHSATITWTNPVGGNWSDAANWSPNQVPTNTDNVLITTPGTYTVNLDVPGVVTNLTLGAGGGAGGVQTFAVTNLLTVSSLVSVTNGGVLNSSGINAGFSGAMTIANGGVLNLAAGYNNFTFTANPLIATNGGVINAGGSPIYGGYGGTEYYYGSTINGTVSVASGGVLNSLGASIAAGLTVAHGGEVNVNSLGMAIKEPLTNSGAINLTDGQLGNDNYDTVSGSAYGELVNLPGGAINLQGSTAIGGGGYIINQGFIVQSAGTNAMNSPVFDNRVGTITNLSGIMTLSLFQTNLAGTYFAAAGATIQFVGADIANDNSAPQLTLGTPLVLGGSGQYQLTSGYLYLPANVPTNLELVGDTLQLGPDFQGGAITNLTLDGMQLLNALPITGTFTANNSEIATNLVVANGGVFSYEGAGLINGTVAVGSGGVFNVINSLSESNSIDILIDTLIDHGVTVAHGGIMNGKGLFTLPTLTNAGTINVSSPFILENGVINQTGGLMNLLGNGGITISNPTNYFINQGAIVQNSGAGTTNMIGYQVSENYAFVINLPIDFDNSQGTITNLSGTLVLPSFQTTLAGIFYAAAGATIQLGGGTIGAPLVPGTPLVLGGGGQYQFICGYLYLAANVIPNLSLQGGVLELGTGFQGGAITNLMLDGIMLTNQLSTALPIKGTFTVLNSGASGSLNSSPYPYGWEGFYGNGVYGNYTVADGGVLTVSNTVIYGTVTVTNGGVLNASSPSTYPPPGETYLYGNIYVERGGVLNASGPYTYLYGNLMIANGGVLNGSAVMYGSVVVASGGALNPVQIELYGPLTNSGTINLTNAAVGILNDGTTNEHGGLINEAGGVINLFTGYGDVSGGGYPVGYDYFINQGRIVKSAGTGSMRLEADFATNSGTITAQTGQIMMLGQWTLLPAGSLNVGLSGATNYGNFYFAIYNPQSGYHAGNAGLNGAFNATLNTGYVPTNGTTFNVLSYGSFTGSFSSLGLPSAVSWQSNYGSTNFSLVAGSELPQFGIVNLLGTNFIFTGMGGSSGSNYVVLASTNLTLPLTNWLPLATNIFDGSGQFRYTNPISPAKPRQFFIFKLP